MNDKESTIYRVLDIVVEECTSEHYVITRNDVLGARRDEPIKMTRCIFVTELLFLGYSKETIAALLNRTKQAIEDMLFRAHEFRKDNWSYRTAEAQATLKVRDIKESL